MYWDARWAGEKPDGRFAACVTRWSFLRYPSPRTGSFRFCWQGLQIHETQIPSYEWITQVIQDIPKPIKDAHEEDADT